MNPRDAKARELTATLHVRDGKEYWTVPSQTVGGRRYTVRYNPDTPHCTCPDHEFRRVRCKHILAVEYTMRHTRDEQGNETVTETVKVTRKTYAQDWPNYNKAQTQEKRLFLKLLADLCSTIPEPDYTFGRPRLPLRDMVFSVTFKVYSTVSTRRFMCDLDDAHDKGYISRVPHYNSICNYLETADLMPILRQLITTASLPLRDVESDFAVDSTGFSTCRHVRWFDAKYGKDMAKHDWIKAHLMCGVTTNVVTSVEVTGGYASDYTQFPYLVETTARNFNVKEIAADAAYSGSDNLSLVVGMGAMPYVPFREGTTGAAGGLWAKLFHYYNFQRDAFLAHYHKRSNAESTVSMLKAKFGERIRSKSDVAQFNELLCKVLCHNICVVIQSIFELGIAPVFQLEAQSV